MEEFTISVVLGASLAVLPSVVLRSPAVVFGVVSFPTRNISRSAGAPWLSNTKSNDKNFDYAIRSGLVSDIKSKLLLLLKHRVLKP